MRSAYGAEEMGIGGQLVTIVVDVANVMGSRPDGWWRDRAGAAVRLHAEIVRLAASGRAILAGEPGAAGEAREAEAGEVSAPAVRSSFAHASAQQAPLPLAPAGLVDNPSTQTLNPPPPRYSLSARSEYG